MTGTITNEALNAFLDQAIKERKKAQENVVYPPIRYLSGGEIKIKLPDGRFYTPPPPGWSPEQN